MTHRSFTAGLAALALGFLLTSNVFAHGTDPRLEISVDRLSPGGVVDVRGVDFEPEEQITLSLTGMSVEIPMGDLTADVEGIFLQTVVLPVDLLEGAYSFRAVTDDHEILSPALFVTGPPIIANEGDSEEDVLIMPIFTAPAPATRRVDLQPEAAPPSAPGSSWPAMAVIAILALGVALIFGMRAIRRR